MIINYGLRQEQIRNIIMAEVNKNADLRYYINDDYIYMLVDAIVDGVSLAIRRNTQVVFQQLEMNARMQ